jgi:hypothetical protein
VRTLVYLMFDVGNDRRREMVEIVIGAGCSEWIRESDPNQNFSGFFSHTFDSRDPRLERLREILQERGVDWIERRDAKYTEAELRSSPLLALWVIRNPVRGGGGRWGTEYDFSDACVECGAGAVQTSPLVLAAKAVPTTGQIAETCAREILVAQPLTEALREAKVSGLELRQAIAYRTHEPLSWWQIISTHGMPPVAPETQGLVRESCWTGISPLCTFPPPCRRCSRDGHYRTIAEPLRVVYRRTDIDLAAVPDVAHTRELFGHSVRACDPTKKIFPGYAQPLILIKQKIFTIFRQLKVRRGHLQFDPVQITDD